MKKHPIILLFALFVSLNNASLAATCPPVKGLNPYNPPSGWTLLIPPIFDDEEYFFSDAVHSLNGSFYYKQIVCKYTSCSSSLCPAYALISTNKYDLPNSRMPPWHYPSTIASTLTCRPPES